MTRHAVTDARMENKSQPVKEAGNSRCHEENQLLVEYWLSRLKDLPVSSDLPLKELVLTDCNAVRNYSVLSEIESLELIQLPDLFRTLPDADYAAIRASRRLPNLRQMWDHEQTLPCN